MEKAHFSCVWCQRPEFFVEVHHIEARASGGPDTLANAAPLCPNCHKHIGPNPDLRKQLRQRRDWWCELCAKRAMPTLAPVLKQTNALFETVKAMEAQGQRTETQLGELKAIVLKFEGERQRAISSARTVDEVVQASTTSLRGKTFPLGFPLDPSGL
jgi:HNH endonuclease